MTRYAVPSLVVAVVVLGLVLGSVLLGVNLLPSSAEAVERGVYAPWMIAWAIILVTDLCGVLLAGFLLAVGVKGLTTATPPARI